MKVVLALAARLLVPGAEMLSTLTLLAAALAGVPLRVRVAVPVFSTV